MVGGSTAFYVAYLAEQRKNARRTRSSPRSALMSGGGAAKPPEIHYEVRDEIGGRGVVHGYGMTEVPMISNGSPHDTDEQLANTDGKPVEGADVRIVTPRRPGRRRPDEEGEVRVKGPMVFHGYTDPALNADAFDEEGYFRTGDLGRLRADGHLTLTGRLKDVIVRKGENISAKEIEDLLYTHPKVVEVAVIGLPDPERGERVCAVVQLAEGADGLELGRGRRLLPRGRPDDPEDPRAARDAHRMAPGRHRQDRQEVAARRVRGPVSRPGPGGHAAWSLPPGPHRRPPLPHRLRLHGQHLPLAHGRGHHPVPGVVHRRSTTAARSATTSTCAAPAPGRGTRASRCTTLAADGAGPGRVPAPWPRGPPVHVLRAGQDRPLVALDRRHQQTLRGLGADPDRLVLLRSFDPASGAAADVPDPYYGDDAAFDECRDMIAGRLRGPRGLAGDPLGHPVGRLEPRPPVGCRTRLTPSRERAGQQAS